MTNPSVTEILAQIKREKELKKKERLKKENAPKNDAHYRKLMGIIRKHVTFSYTSRQKLTGGKKANITKAYKAIREVKNATFLDIPKKRGESKSHYKKRVHDIKKKYSQPASALKFIPIYTTSTSKPKLDKNSNVVFRAGHYKKTKIVPFATHAYIALEDDARVKYITDFIDKNKRKSSTQINFINHHGATSQRGFPILDGDKKPDYDEVIEWVLSKSDEYLSDTLSAFAFYG